MNLRSNKFVPKREDWFSYLPFVSPRKSGIDGKPRCGSPKRRPSLNFPKKIRPISTFLLYLCFSVFFLSACDNTKDRNSLASNDNTATGKTDIQNIDEDQRKTHFFSSGPHLRIKMAPIYKEGIEAIQNRAIARWPGHGPYKFPTMEDRKAVPFPKDEGPRSINAEFNAIMQIPEKVLSKMPTDDLIMTCLSYPFFASGLDTSRYGSFKTSYKNFTRRFNGFHELSQRSDAGSELIKYFKTLSVNPEMKDTFFRTGDIKPSTNPLHDKSLLIKYTTAILSDEDIAEYLKLEEKYSLLSESLNKLVEIESYEYSVLPEKCMIYLVGHSLKLLGYKPILQKMRTDEKIANFILGKSDYIDDVSMGYIVNTGKKALKDRIS